MPPKKINYPDGFSRVKILRGNTNRINRIAWSSDGQNIASSAVDGSVNVWNAETGKKIWSPTTNETSNFAYSVAWSPDYSKLAAGFDEGIKAWSTYFQEELWHFKPETEGGPGDIKFSPDGETIAAGYSNRNIYLLHSANGRLIRELTQHKGAVPSIAWSPDGKILASGSFDKTILLWKHGDAFLKLEGHNGPVWDIAWSPNGDIIASASADHTAMLWDPKTGRQIITLEGHTGEVRGVAFSFDGSLFATKSYDGSVRLWRADNYQLVSVLNEPNKYQLFGGLAFHPYKLSLATLASGSKSIRIWNLDPEIFFRSIQTNQSERYLNAKVVLVGDTGVGKSGLALVLTNKQWAETGSTHGRRVWVFDEQIVEGETGLQETHEILLWDLAGQPDYRLIHQLHLTEVAIALVIFDSRSQTAPFAGVKHWDKALRQAQRVQTNSLPPTKKYLVSARVDVGRIGVSSERINSLMREMNFDGYFETSAKEGWGIKELSDAIRNSIDWESLPCVSSTGLFQSIKSFLVKEKETGRLLSTLEDLYRSYLNTHNTANQVEDFRAQFVTCIGRVESRGLIQRLSFGDLILLQPELQDVYASAIANAVKDEPDGLGCILEDKARRGEFRIPESERIKDVEQEKLLLISTVEDLLRHEIALREHGEDGQYLVFPSQLTRENPDLPDPEGKAVVYNFEGPVLNIYATLAVRLSYSGLFNKKEMWKNAATYSASVGGTCGMFLREISEGRGELTLFFDAQASEETKFQFEEYIRIHLQRRALPESINRRRIFGCHECSTPIADLAAKRRRERGHDWIACNVCEPPPRISLLDREERLMVASGSKIYEMDRSADLKRNIEAAASTLQGKIATGDFDVFLCHNSKDKEAVKRIGELLKARGILPWLDEWELRPGLPWQELLEQQIAQIKSAAVFVGKEGMGPWQQQELNAFLREFVDRGCPVIPVVLKDAPKKPDLPIFLRGMTWVDFRKENPDPLKRLVWGITGKREQNPSLDEFESPFADESVILKHLSAVLH